MLADAGALSVTERMAKVKPVLYWISTLWLSLGMVSTGIVQILKVKADVDFIIQMGYPVYFLTIIGVWKLLGTAAVLVPGFRLLKEWAYAGFFFMMTGAVFSHMATGHPVKDMLPPTLLLVLTLLSWYLRPAGRRINQS